MKGFWVLHIAGALLFAALLGLYLAPDAQLPQRLVSPRSRARAGLTGALAPWVAPQGAPPSEESVQLMRQMVREKYEDRIEQLERTRASLRQQLREKEK